MATAMRFVWIFVALNTRRQRSTLHMHSAIIQNDLMNEQTKNRIPILIMYHFLS